MSSSEKIMTDNGIQFNSDNWSEELLLSLYKGILTPRMIEEKMLLLLRQGRISKWFSGIGQEAISVGAARALEPEEFILPMHRNLGIFTSRKIPLDRLFSQFQGKLNGFTQGRDRSFHFGATDFHIVGMISHLGPQLGVADGIALASKLNKESKATLVFCGDGGSSEGDFHEALNVAAVWNLPVIFMIENNGYGLSTPSSEQFKFKNFIDKGPGYGIETDQVDGNNILEVYSCVDKWAKSIRSNPRPVLIEALTFRMRGHEEASGTKYVPKELMELWAKKDPFENYESHLLSVGILNKKLIENYRAEIAEQIDQGLELAYSESLPKADRKKEQSDIYAPHVQTVTTPSTTGEPTRFIDGITSGLHHAMLKHTDLVLMGQDIAEYGGVFKATIGFLEEFGHERVRNTPLCESAILGIGLGLSVRGRKSMIEMQFADFVTSGFNQVVNNLAKSHYRWGQNADVVIRMPTGAGVGAGPFHSQSNEAWFYHTPGLKIVYPSNAYDAKGLLLAAFEDPNPYLFFEHKYLYRSQSTEVPEEYYTCEIGKAAVRSEGVDLSIITYGLGVHWALEVLEEFKGISIEVLDLRTLMPWDKEAVLSTVAKTNRVLVLHEDTETGGIGGDISAWISENCFEHLDAPIVRLGALDTPVPFSSNLEADFLPKSRLVEKIKFLVEF